jgi:hypothetical protein
LQQDRNDDDSEWTSTCLNYPPRLGETKALTLVAEYEMTLSSSDDTDKIMNRLQQHMHNSIVQQYMDCDYASYSFKVVSVTTSAAQEEDDVVSVACSASSPANAACYVAATTLELVIYFPPPLPRRRLQEEDAIANDPAAVRTSFANFFTNSMESDEWVDEEILQLVFLGFRETDDVDGDNTMNGGVANSSNKSVTESGPDRSNVAIGSAILALAAICLVVVIVLSVRKKWRQEQDIYLKQVDDLSAVSTISLDRRDLGSDGKVMLVMDDDLLEDGCENAANNITPHPDTKRSGHDVHRCASATCPECQRSIIRPTFVSTQISMDDIRHNYPFGRRDGSSVVTPDTVDL